MALFYTRLGLVAASLEPLVTANDLRGVFGKSEAEHAAVALLAAARRVGRLVRLDALSWKDRQDCNLLFGIGYLVEKGFLKEETCADGTVTFCLTEAFFRRVSE